MFGLYAEDDTQANKDSTSRVASQASALSGAVLPAPKQPAFGLGHESDAAAHINLPSQQLPAPSGISGKLGAPSNAALQLPRAAYPTDSLLTGAAPTKPPGVRSEIQPTPLDAPSSLESAPTFGLASELSAAPAPPPPATDLSDTPTHAPAFEFASEISAAPVPPPSATGLGSTPTHTPAFGLASEISAVPATGLGSRMPLGAPTRAPGHLAPVGEKPRTLTGPGNAASALLPLTGRLGASPLGAPAQAPGFGLSSEISAASAPPLPNTGLFGANPLGAPSRARGHLAPGVAGALPPAQKSFGLDSEISAAAALPTPSKKPPLMLTAQPDTMRGRDQRMGPLRSGLAKRALSEDEAARRIQAAMLGNRERRRMQQQFPGFTPGMRSRPAVSLLPAGPPAGHGTLSTHSTAQQGLQPEALQPPLQQLPWGAASPVAGQQHQAGPPPSWTQQQQQQQHQAGPPPSWTQQQQLLHAQQTQDSIRGLASGAGALLGSPDGTQHQLLGQQQPHSQQLQSLQAQPKQQHVVQQQGAWGEPAADVHASQQQSRRSAIGPVIDSSCLPRYGLLAPPPPVPPAAQERPVYYDRVAGLMVHNRGALREAVARKTGYLQDAPVRMWADFAARQQARHVPASPDAMRRVLPASQGYRLRILRVKDLPVHMTFDGRTFEFQLGVSLYDEAYGTFYGNTVYSYGDGFDRSMAAQRNTIDMDFSYDVFWHTRISDPRCMAVVEVIMLERGPDGVITGRYSLGWALLPLFQMGGATGPAAAAAGSAPQAVPIVSGTPRYLLMRSVYNEDLRAPKVLQNCSLIFQAESFPALTPIMPLLPEDFLVSYSDVVPGLRRFDGEGELSITTKQCISTLASPLMSPIYSVVLRRLQLALPMRLHELLQALDYKQDMAVGQGTFTGTLRYSIRVSLHNGRTFVGPSYNLQNMSAMDVPGWKVLQILMPNAVFDYVMGDVMTTIVVELMAEPPQMVLPNTTPARRLVGWTAFVPFTYVSDDGSRAEVAVGVHRYPLREPRKGLLLRDLPPLNWRALLGDKAKHSLPSPLVEFQLFETDRHPIAPPQKGQQTAAIQTQREQEEALGERPLEDVMAVVPVPQELDAAPLLAEEQLGLVPRPPPASSPRLSPRPPPGSPGTRSQVDPRMSVDEGMLPPSMQHQSQRNSTLQQLSESVAADGSLLEPVHGIQAAIQQQLQMLTRAVEDLREERKSLRDSLSVSSLQDQQRQPSPARISYPPSGGAGLVQQMFEDDRARVNQAPPTPDEIKRFRDLPPTEHFGHPHAFAGAPAPASQQPSTAPSRMVLQQLHDAGMVDALPDDVQAMLRMQGGTRQPSSLPYDLAIEARDGRTASDFVLQILSYRHHETLNAPANLQSLYFTFQFYHFPPTTTDMAYLIQPKPQLSAPVTTGHDGVHPPSAAAAAAGASAATRILVTNHPLKKGAGIVVKHALDGSVSSLSPGQSPLAAAKEAHMAFAAYLVSHSLSMDVWDGDSLLQVGTATLELAPLLRQGREFSELLVELPIMLHEHQQQQTTQQAAALAPGALDTPTILSRGSVVVRAINIGREPRDASPLPQASDGSSSTHMTGKRTRVRARPAWYDVHGPIARELANGDHPDVIEQMHQQLGGYGGGASQVPIEHWGGDFGLMLDPQQQLQRRQQQLQEDERKALLVHNAIMARSKRKCARVLQLRNLAEADKGQQQQQQQQLSIPRASDHLSRVQQQVLVDVSGARARKKQAFIREQLKKSMVTRQVVKPAYGEVVVYEFPFVNPYSHEMVFELHISSPSEVSILARGEEYRGLRAANARFIRVDGVERPGDLEPEMMGGNRLYMRANERVVLPLKIQSLQPPHGYGPPLVAPTTVAPHKASQALSHALPTPEHVISVDIVSASQGHSVGVLELQILPQPLIIDRTFRFSHPERELMRQVINLSHLTGGGAASCLTGPALRSLAVAASHPEVVTGAGSSAMADTPGTRDEVYIKYKCGPAPEVTQFYVVLFGDRLLARPIEVWQVFVHSLRKVDMRAMIGQSSTASVVVRGAMVSRRVAAYASHPDELQVAPDTFVLVAGALTEILISFKPVLAGPKDIKVHLVDVESRELVYALIVAAEGLGPLVTRTFEMEIPVGTVANKKISYTNPYPAFRTFTMRSNQPWLLQFTPPRLQLPGGATRPLGLTFDARMATTGIMDVLVFVNDEEERTEECFKIRKRIHR